MVEEDAVIGECPIHGLTILSNGKCPKCGTELKPFKVVRRDVVAWLLMLLWP